VYNDLIALPIAMAEVEAAVMRSEARAGQKCERVIRKPSYLMQSMHCVTGFLSAALIFSESFTSVMVVAVALGVAKGFRTVYMTIVIPSYVPIERLAAASGIQMVVNGILLMAFGPLIGK
jgi:MFS family permease